MKEILDNQFIGKRLITLLIIFMTAYCVIAQNRSEIVVHTDKQGLKASPLLYGIFIEDWSHQVEGGIYAEMIRNRSFDDTKSSKEVLLVGFAMNMPGQEKVTDGKNIQVPGWKKIEDQPDGLKWSYDQSMPLNENNPRCLKIEVSEYKGRAGIYNVGHCTNVEGIAVTKGKDYLFSCYVRSEEKNGTLTVKIEAPNGKSLASKTINGFSKEWKKFEFTLTPDESLTGARLFISPKAGGTYYLDMVSLFPKETWKNRPNGLRNDLMDLVAGLKPRFVRFPGGCFVEGLGIVNSWQWKKTIGPIEQRPGHWNIWGWRSTDGLGYFEYLQMCEDLGAEPLHVVNDGISHDINDPYNGKYEYVPMDQMNNLVQDALDAIEYANGPVNSKWGAKRAEAGHPKPFNLKFIEVGNENFGPEYAERYPLFQDAIKAKYPEITVIMDTYGADNYPKNRTPDMRDIHRFATPYLFAVNYHQFDKYEPKEPKVYFGEWCAQLENPKKETLETGLYEGAFLTGLEKNSDRVLMQSYAPFMKNMGWKDGKPNMINFDLDRAYGAPIYWIQKMYAENSVDELLKFEVVSPEIPLNESGCIGLGTQDTQAEFKDIRVERGNKLLLSADNLSEKDYKSGKKEDKGWTLNNGAFTQVNDGNQSLIFNKEFTGNYTISLKARKLSGKNGFRIYFLDKAYCDLGGNGNKNAQFDGGDIFWKGGGLTPLQQIKNLSIETNRWYDLRLEVNDYDISCYVDNNLVNNVSLLPMQTLYVSAGKDLIKNEVVLKVINVSSKLQSTQVKLPGLTLEPSGEATVITSKDPYAKNSLEHPNNVIPQTSKIRNISSDFEYLFPAYSATVLRFKAKQ